MEIQDNDCGCNENSIQETTNKPCGCGKNDHCSCHKQPCLLFSFGDITDPTYPYSTGLIKPINHEQISFEKALLKGQKKAFSKVYEQLSNNKYTVNCDRLLENLCIEHNSLKKKGHCLSVCKNTLRDTLCDAVECFAIVNYIELSHDNAVTTFGKETANNTEKLAEKIKILNTKAYTAISDTYKYIVNGVRVGGGKCFNCQKEVSKEQYTVSSCGTKKIYPKQEKEIVHQMPFAAAYTTSKDDIDAIVGY